MQASSVLLQNLMHVRQRLLNTVLDDDRSSRHSSRASTPSAARLSRYVCSILVLCVCSLCLDQCKFAVCVCVHVCMHVCSLCLRSKRIKGSKERFFKMYFIVS